MGRHKTTTTIGNVPDRTAQVQEVVKCGTDASFFISKYVKISHPIKGPIPFKTFPYQDRCLKAFQTNRFVITNKSRQLGLSTLSAAFSLWMALFQREKNILIIATKLSTAQLFITKVKGMFESLPKWLVMPEVVTCSKSEITFSNGSKIKATPTSLSSGRGDSLSLLIFDEAAHIETIEELWLAIRPAISTGGNCIMISSPSGVGTLFHKIWIGASQGENGEGNPMPGTGTNAFYRIELPWTVHPERNQEWYDKEAAEIRSAKGERGVLQELKCVFGASGDSFLPLDILDILDKSIVAPISFYGPRNDVWIWKMPVDGHKYIIGADIARGDAEDFSAFHVIDTSMDEIVAEYQGKIPPEQLATLMIDLGQRYNNALLCPELNSFGLLTSTALKKSGYKNLYYEKMAKNMHTAYLDADIRDEMPGFTTNQKNREEIIAKLENSLRFGKIRIYSSRMIDEIKTLVWKTNGRAQAMKGYNDDLSMSLAISLSLYEASGVNIWNGVEMTTSLIAGMSVGIKKMNSVGMMFGNENKFVPPIMTSDGVKEYAQHQNAQINHEMKKQGSGQDFRNYWWGQWSWVLDK